MCLIHWNLHVIAFKNGFLTWFTWKQAGSTPVSFRARATDSWKTLTAPCATCAPDYLCAVWCQHVHGMPTGVCGIIEYESWATIDGGVIIFKYGCPAYRHSNMRIMPFLAYLSSIIACMFSQCPHQLYSLPSMVAYKCIIPCKPSERLSDGMNAWKHIIYHVQACQAVRTPLNAFRVFYACGISLIASDSRDTPVVWF